MSKIERFMKVKCPVCGENLEVLKDGGVDVVQVTRCFCTAKLEIHKDTQDVTVLTEE